MKAGYLSRLSPTWACCQQNKQKIHAGLLKNSFRGCGTVVEFWEATELNLLLYVEGSSLCAKVLGDKVLLDLGPTEVFLYKNIGPALAIWLSG